MLLQFNKYVFWLPHHQERRRSERAEIQRVRAEKEKDRQNRIAVTQTLLHRCITQSNVMYFTKAINRLVSVHTWWLMYCYTIISLFSLTMWNHFHHSILLYLSGGTPQKRGRGSQEEGRRWGQEEESAVWHGSKLWRLPGQGQTSVKTTVKMMMMMMRRRW